MMIAASEPLEFVPHGRGVLENHPGKIYDDGRSSLSEHSLLYKLTNFAIKDESLLDTKEKEEQEWWSVREIFARKSDDFEGEEPCSPKESKDEYMSESFRPQSRLKSDFNISIKSELMSGVKKLDVEAPTSRGSSANSSSDMSKKFNLGTNQNCNRNKKPLDPKSDCCYEEELYVKNCTAVWSKGLVSTPATRLSAAETRETVACYTIENPIKHALFCNFHVTINNTMLIDALNSQIGDVKKNIKIEDTTEHLPKEIMPSIMLVDNKCVRVYAKDGREYVTSVPFQVKRVWPMKYGVLLEKDATPLIHNTLLPMSFLKLNESHNSTFNRSKSVPMNMSAKLRQESLSAYDQDIPLPTCFSMSHPLDEVTPLLMKTSQGLQYYNDGDIQIVFVGINPSIILIYDWKMGTHSLWKLRRAYREECLSMCPNVNTTATFNQTCDFASPMNSHKNTTSWATGVGSPYNSKRIGTPNFSRSRLNSPMANAFQQQGMSPHTSIGQASSVSMMANTMVQAPPSLPLYPDICLDHVWTDTQTIRRDPIDDESDFKSFLHTDLVGHEYLCFMVRVCNVTRLQIARLQRSHSHGQLNKTNIMVGAVSSVIARDAVALEHLHMIALIDENGNIILQSGNSVVGKVHAGGVLARWLRSFPRRSSLLPTASTAPCDDRALHLLSPVPHITPHTHGVQGLRDAAGNRLTLKFEKGVMYRITLPEISCSALVNKCCTALKAILPKDVTMQVIIKWYGTRNAPGTQDLTPEQEWSMFANLLYSLIGYDLERLSLKRSDEETSEVVTKKQRTSNDGTHNDWEYMLSSKLHKHYGNSLANMLNLKQIKSETQPQITTKTTEIQEKVQFNSNSLLFPYTLQILYAFHLIYEDTKLNTLLLNDLEYISGLLYQIAKDLRQDKYVTHYWLDFPTEFMLEYDENESQMNEECLKKMTQPSYFTSEPPNVFAYLNSMLQNVEAGFYPYLPDVNNDTKNIIEVLRIMEGGGWAGVRLIGEAMAHSTPRGGASAGAGIITAVAAMRERGLTVEEISKCPPGVSAWLLRAIAACRLEPLVLSGEETRDSENDDVLDAEVHEKETAYSLRTQPEVDCFQLKSDDKEDVRTGMEHLDTKLLRLLYPKDHRMAEVFKLLQSSIPVTINLTQRPEVSDHDFIEEQEKHLFALSTRTMALPIARGMVSYASRWLACTEALPPPPLVLAGRGAGGRPLELAAAGRWPHYHNGAAAALAACLPRQAAGWLLYNTPKSTTEMSNEHAGFLMGLGLNGHLKDMPFMNIYEYLVKCNEMISIGLLLGLAATYKGTMDVQATKMMSIHLEPLLPPTSIELDIHQNILVAALLGLGLIYQGTMHAHYASVLLNEIGKPSTHENEGCTEREGYSLAGGLALGLVCAAGGEQVPSYVPRQLRTLLLGAAGTQKERTKPTKESTINLDVTSPGATLALGLMFLGTSNKTVANWLEPPSTSYLLDFVRPDLLMLRCIARGLILLHEIEPEDEWVESQVPSTIKPYCFVKPTEDTVDYEAMNQAYCNIVAGACFAMGLRFAGTGNEDARDVCLSYTNFFYTLAGKSLGELAGRSTLESCLCVCLLAAGMIMCGRGDLAVFRVCRALRCRGLRAKPPPATTHGAQMAVHMALGLLFLGGGRFTLSTTPTAIGALLAAFFPKFPTHSEDNRYHLQAFRHLYVLAVEARLLLPRDLNTGRLCYAHIQVVDLKGVVKEMKAPCLIPALDSLKEVRITEPRYWPIVYTKDQNWNQLEKLLANTRCIDIKPRAGCLSYLDDPHGFKTLLAQTLTLDKSNVWSATPENIHLFTSDEDIRSFTKHYLSLLEKLDENSKICPDCLMIDRRKKKVRELMRTCQCRKYSKAELEFVQALSMVTYECVIKDVLCALPVWTTFLKIVKTLKTEPSSYHMWQVKLLHSQMENQNRKLLSNMAIDGEDAQEELIISTELAMSITQKVENILDTVEIDINPYLRKYLGLPSSRKIGTTEDLIKKTLSAYLVYYDIPKAVFRGVNCNNTLTVLLEEPSLSVKTVSKLQSLL